MSKQNANQQNPRWRAFFGAHPDANKADYIAWIRRNSAAFRESRAIRADFVPPDLQDEFTDWLRLQCMEVSENG